MAQTTYSFVSPQVLIARSAAALYGTTVGTANMATYVNTVAQTSPAALLNAVYSNSIGGSSTVNVADTLIANLGITGQSAIDAVRTYIVGALDSVSVDQRGAAVSTMLNQFANLTTDPTYGPAATAWNAKITSAVTYATVPGNMDISNNLGVGGDYPFQLGLGQDRMAGTTGSDTFVAPILNNSNTLQSGDIINGGDSAADQAYIALPIHDRMNHGSSNSTNGTATNSPLLANNADTLMADIGNSQNFAITPETTNVENIAIRAEAVSTDSTDNNLSRTNEVQIDAQRMQGVYNWENNNSRADLLIEDVRIPDNKITQDVTITMRETDPGHVDYGVYFDQYSLRANTASSGQVTLQVHNTLPVVKGYNPATPLLSAGGAGGAAYSTPYTAVSFDVNGKNKILDLNLTKVATYDQLGAALQDALAVIKAKDPEMAGVTITQQKNGDTGTNGAGWFSDDGQLRITDQYVVTVAGGVVSKPTTAGWLVPLTGLPADNTISAYQTTATSSSVDLVTSRIIVDDVGRGSMGGDLVVGGLSVGDTSTSKGVQRFEIQVQDNSKLQTISSTNNTLREVVITNGTTDHQITTNTYVPTAANIGNLTVTGAFTTTNTLGNGTVIGADSSGNVGIINQGLITATSNNPSGNLTNVAIDNGVDAALPGQETVMGGDQHNAYGFTDVRLIDGSAMNGKLTFTALLDERAIAKYINLGTANPVAGMGNDTVANPAADNNWKTEVAPGKIHNPSTVGVEYYGGSNNDTMAVVVDPAVAASRSTILAGREDFNFKIDGGAGDDNITVSLVNPATNVVAPANTLQAGQHLGIAAAQAGNYGGYQDWYNNQALNNNVSISGGAGNDTIRKPGAGNANISGGDGNDTVYTDNTGVQSIMTHGAVNPDTAKTAGNVTGTSNPTTNPAANSNSNGIWVFNTKDQIGIGSNDRSINDFRSDVNDKYALNPTANLTVSFKGLVSANTSIFANAASATPITSDLEINQAIKRAINTDPVLNKLLVAEDGPANALVVRSLIDGYMTTGDLNVNFFSTNASTTATADQTTAFQNLLTKRDYVTAMAVDAQDVATFTPTLVDARNGVLDNDLIMNSKAVNSVADTGVMDSITGRPSLATTDNIVTPGAGDDVVVLSTTAGIDRVTSSNEVIKYVAADANFGNDTIVNFTPARQFYINNTVNSTFTARNGVDYLDLRDIIAPGQGGADYTAWNTINSANNGITIAPLATGINTTPGEVAAQFANSGASNAHVYIAVDTSSGAKNNVGYVYTNIGTGAATLRGSIDLAATPWQSLSTENFVNYTSQWSGDNYFTNNSQTNATNLVSITNTNTTANAAGQIGVNEGQNATFDVIVRPNPAEVNSSTFGNTPAVQVGETLAYTLSGVHTTRLSPTHDLTTYEGISGDVASLKGISSPVFLGTDGLYHATITVPVLADQITEGEQTMTITLDGSVNASPVSSSVRIFDTSLTPIIRTTTVTGSGASATQSVNEGQTATFTVQVPSNLVNTFKGTSLNFFVSGDVGATNITAGDATALAALAGTSTQVDSNGMATITVPVTADQLTEGPEQMFVSLTDARLTGLVGQASFASITINDTSTSIITAVPSAVNVIPLSVNEGETQVFNVQLPASDIAANAGKTLAYTLSGLGITANTGVAGAALGDVASLKGVSSVVDSTGKATISVPVQADLTTEGAEALTVTLDAYPLAKFVNAFSTVTINDTSLTAGPAVSTITATAANVGEGASATFNVFVPAALAVPAGTQLPFTLSGTGITAGDVNLAGLLTGLSSATVNDANGNATATITVPVVADTTTEGAETLVVSLTAAPTVTSSIIINDTSVGTGPARQAISLSVANDKQTSVDASAGNIDFTVTPGNYTYTVLNFSKGDTIDFPQKGAGFDNNPSFSNASVTDGKVDISYVPPAGGTTAIITLTGIPLAIDQTLGGVADLNTAFGAGTII